MMEMLHFDLSKRASRFKILNATNGGPWHKRHTNRQKYSNFEAYKAARIPYSRNHDSAANGIYGGPYSHDISNIFPNFDADPQCPESYDFACTDEAILACLDAGTATYFRLGQTIEHQIVKHHVHPPKDFKKWAVICEHIIRHYNEGWANGHHLNIQYWEIWNEPELDLERENKRTWTGTIEQFFDFYEIAAKHLKGCFPQLKIGGPAFAGVKVVEPFLEEMQKRKVPMDFLSWHAYAYIPEQIAEKAEYVREQMVKYGYGDAEMHLNEWNYVKDWTEGFVDLTLSGIHSMKGAAFIMAVISLAQASPLDMLMYYDTRPSTFCGPFDFYTARPKKPYYPLYWYGMFYDMMCEIRAENRIENIYSLCGVDKNGKTLTVLTHYNDDEAAQSKCVEIDFGRSGKYEIYLLDEEHSGTLVATTEDLTFELQCNTCVLIKEV